MYEILPYATETSPYFKNVKSAYVLTLTTAQGRRRMKSEKRVQLTQLCHTTYVQYNTPFNAKGNTKPSYIDTTAKDLTHAYKNLAAHILKTTKDKHVLILEDDAEIFEENRSCFTTVDQFLTTYPYDIYSLGSFGNTYPFDANHGVYGSTFGFSQAIIWHRKALKQLIKSDVSNHIDVHFLMKLSLKYTFKKPLVVQLFEDTDNTKTWCFMCNNGYVEWGIVKAWQIFLQDILSLRTNPYHWNTLYLMNYYGTTTLYHMSWLFVILVAYRANKISHTQK